MTTTLTSDGHIALPKKLRTERKLRAGDYFELIPDEDDPNLILLRRVAKAPKTSWVDVLFSCPEKGWFRRMPRRQERMRNVRL